MGSIWIPRGPLPWGFLVTVHLGNLGAAPSGGNGGGGGKDQEEIRRLSWCHKKQIGADKGNEE
jgi:hypothetical protein